MSLRVPLHDLLVELGGDMGEFAGFRTALSFGDPISEHNAVRNSAGVFDISHMGRIYVIGPRSFDLLDKLIPKDLSSSENGRMIGPTAFLNERGGFKDDVMIYRFNESRWLIVCNAVNRIKILSWLREWRDRLGYSDIVIDDVTLNTAFIALQGPEAASYLEKIKDLKDSLSLKHLEFHTGVASEYGVIDLISRSGWTGEDGFEILGEPRVIGEILRRLKTLGVKLAGLIARDTLRLEMGFVLYGNDIDEDTNPYEARYWVFDDDKRECIGCDALRELGLRGVSRVRYGIRTKKGVRFIPRHGYEILYRDNVIGYVTSGGYSPYLDRGIGMGYIKASHALPGLNVVVRFKGRSVEAKIVDFPLIKR
ncbi:MAG: glycine cleavage system aminomethyltransferase GcvT [Sulfolobales archaeon]